MGRSRNSDARDEKYTRISVEYPSGKTPLDRPSPASGVIWKQTLYEY
jgi:hypothetical protein